MRKRYVQINGVLYERGHEPVAEGPMVIEDIQPYQSQITGEMITSRSQHREHLKRHNCFEVGNEMPKPRQPITTSREQRIKRLREQLWNMTDRQADKILAEIRSQQRR